MVDRKYGNAKETFGEKNGNVKEMLDGNEKETLVSTKNGNVKETPSTFPLRH